VPSTLATLEAAPQTSSTQAVADEARRGLTSTPKCLSPWLFYDEAGSRLFEQITTLPEYYLTRTERDLFAAHADEIFRILRRQTGCPTTCPEPAEEPALSLSKGSGLSDVGPHNITIAELGAGTATKTGILLRALTRQQPSVLYQPIDISSTALDDARDQLEHLPGLTVRPRTANYVTESFRIERPPHTRILALYIGSSIGNFSPAEAGDILTRLRSQLAPGDALLLGTDLAPSPTKSIASLLAAYNDPQGVTAAFNRNILARLNRDLGANFHPERFLHRALWNPTHSRIEMHLEPITPQTIHIPANTSGTALTIHLAPGESIHTENSYKFTPASIANLLAAPGFTPTRTLTDPKNLFAVTLATAV
jgi:dimethylhistidine N-methyltransferase